MGKNRDKNIENLQYAVYGGICGVFGLLALLLLFFSGFNCKSDALLMIAVSFVCGILGFLAIFFGLKAKKHIQGKSIILLGILIFVLLVLLYFVALDCM